MHSFENTEQYKQKKENWNLLVTFFKRRGIPIEIKNSDSLILNENEATLEFVKQVYTLLTERQLMPPIKIYETSNQTQSMLLKDKELIQLPRNDMDMFKKDEDSKKDASMANQSTSKSPPKSLSITKGP